MKKLSLIFLLLVPIFTFAACSRPIPYAASSVDASVNAGAVSLRELTGTPQSDLPEHDESVSDESIMPTEPEGQMEQEKKLILSVNGSPLNVSWENNNTVDELIAYAQTETIVVATTRYGGFEQVGSLPQGFSRNDVQMTTEPGDIVLYSGNQLVVFFGANSWSYTKLGHIEGLSEQRLSELLYADSAVIEIKVNHGS